MEKKYKKTWINIKILLSVLGVLVMVGCGIWACHQYKVHKNAEQLMDTHGLEMFLSYEDYEEKIAQGETFMVYIGRATCPYCKVLTTVLEKEKGKIQSQMPFYYFNVIWYKQAILDKKAGAEEKWNTIKKEIGFQYIPCILYYKEGKLESSFLEFVGEDYFDIEDDKEKEKLVEQATLKLEKWFQECSLDK